MKKLFCVLLTFVIAAMCLSGLAESTAETAPALPAVGDVVHGFEVVGIRDFPLINAVIVRFEHQRTGAELFYVANQDNNRLFDLTFKTRAIDNTGLPHVFEHATLDGSEKYPSKALFFNLSYQTYNTLMNAFTYQNMTTYPVASLSEAQLLKLADFYADSCFHPMILDDESIYREEAWRYRMDSADADLTIEGTVYSEMQGAMTLETAAMYNAGRETLPGSMSANVSGGNPADIPDMTYEALCAYHDLYYHPSNCIAYLYGQFDDYTAFLALLDGVFAPYDRVEFSLEDADYTPIDAPVTAEYAFPVEAGSSTENASSVLYTYVCPGLRDDAAQIMVLNNLCSLLSDSSSALSLTLQRRLPTCQSGVSLEFDAPDICLQFIAQKINREDADTFREIVDEALADVVENGLPEDQVDSIMTSLEISTRLIGESSDLGQDVVPALAYYYTDTGDPYFLIEIEDALTGMDDMNRQGLYGDAITRWVADNPLNTLVTTYPEPGAKEAQDAALAGQLAEIKAAMSEEEIQAIVDASNAEDTDTAETAAMVASLQAVTVESLPEEYQTCSVSDETGEDTVRRINAIADVDGVGKVSLLFDARGLAQEDIHWFHLFADLIGELDTNAHTWEELQVLINRYLYSVETRLSICRVDDEYFPRLRLGWIGLDEDLAQGYDLMHEIVYDTRFDDVDRVQENLEAIRSNLKANITQAPYNTILNRAISVTSPAVRYSNYYNNLDYYAFIEEVQRLFDEDPESAIARLTATRDYFNNRHDAIAAYAGSEAGIAVNAPLADAYMASLEDRPIEPVAYDLPVPAEREALIVDSAVQYNAIVLDYESLGVDGFSADLSATASLVTDTFLLPQLRDQYGAYGVQHDALDLDGVYIFSYRDPNITQTFQVYEQLPDMLTDMALTQETLDGYILSTYTQYAKSDGALSTAAEVINKCLENEPQDKILEDMRNLKAMTPETVLSSVEMYRNLAEKGQRSTAGSAAAINASAELYDVILNPFGAVDRTQAAFSDVTEDMAAYAAIRDAFENGLMQPAEDGFFGADAPATVGDMAYALYGLAGGADYTPADAIAALASYGLMDAAAQPEDPLSADDCRALIDTFTAAIGASDPAVTLPEGDALNRAQLAQILSDYTAWLEQLSSNAA